MPWLRVIQWDFSFDCCYEGNAQLSKKPYYRNRRHITKFLKRPLDDLEVWAREKAMKLSLDRADYSCRELAAKFSGCLVELLNFRFSEVLIPEFRVRMPAGEEIRLPPRKPMKIELDQLSLLEDKLRGYENELKKYQNFLKGQNAQVRIWEEDTEAEESFRMAQLTMAKKAQSRLRNSVRIQKEVIERQKKAIADFKTKIGMLE